VAFSWAYYHFILEDGVFLPSRKLVIKIDPTDYTRLVLGHSLSPNHPPLSFPRFRKLNRNGVPVNGYRARNWFSM
jgi:hypothetical protein